MEHERENDHAWCIVILWLWYSINIYDFKGIFERIEYALLARFDLKNNSTYVMIRVSGLAQPIILIIDGKIFKT